MRQTPASLSRQNRIFFAARLRRRLRDACPPPSQGFENMYFETQISWISLAAAKHLADQAQLTTKIINGLAELTIG